MQLMTGYSTVAVPFQLINLPTRQPPQNRAQRYT